MVNKVVTIKKIRVAGYTRGERAGRMHRATREICNSPFLKSVYILYILAWSEGESVKRIFPAKEPKHLTRCLSVIFRVIRTAEKERTNRDWQCNFLNRPSVTIIL